MKKLLLLITWLFTLQCITAQNTWTQKTDFGGTARIEAVGFSIGTKGYIGTGRVNLGYKKDFWEYDPSANTWTQKADFGGTARNRAVGFSIGTKGYIGTGMDVDNHVYKKDFWEYDPSANTWTQKTDFGGTARESAVGFGIGTKGYIGTGLDENNAFKKDFWEYDPSANTWTKMIDFGGTARRGAVGFSIGTKGYIGTGQDVNQVLKKDFWAYDPSTRTWTQKTDFGGTAWYSAVAFGIGTKGYVGGTGADENNAFKKDFWEYDPSTNTWTQKTDFGGTARHSAVGFSIGTKGYIGTGTYTYNSNYRDFWEYETYATATVAPTVTTTTASSTTMTTASSGGNVTSDGDATVTARGVAYGTTTAPTTGTSEGTETGTFTSSLTGLTPGTKYYYRAYATNSVGTSYGAEMSFTTAYNPPGNALNFDGVDDNVSTTPLVANLNNFTIEGWIKRTDVTGYHTLYSETNTGTNSQMLSIVAQPGSNGFEIVLRNASQTGLVISSTRGVAPAGVWTHVALVRTSSTTAILYINGTATDNFTFTNPGTFTLNTAHIGVRQRAITDGYFNGNIDEVKLWNVARTPVQIQADLRYIVSPFSNPNLVLYYNFDQGTAGGNNLGITTLYDQTANGNNGTLNNFALTGNRSNW